MQAAARCQPAPSLLFFQNKEGETCSGDPFTSRTISSYIMTQVWLPANCCSKLGKTISSPLRAASVHNAGFVPPCHRPRHVRESLAHPSSSEVAEGRGKGETAVLGEAAPAARWLCPRQGGDPCEGWGRRGWSPSASAFLSRHGRDDGKSVVAPQGRDSSDPSAENGMRSFGVWLPALPGALMDLGFR